MKASDFIWKIGQERIALDLGDDIKLEVQDSSDHWVRYRCGESAGGQIYYEISRFSQDVYVSIQDERERLDRGSLLRRKMKEIGERHDTIIRIDGRLDRGRYGIRHKCCDKPKIHCYRGFEDIKRDVEDAMRDLYELYDPLFRSVLPEFGKSEGEGLSAVEKFIIPTVLTAREMVVQLRQKDMPFRMTDGEVLRPLTLEGGWSEGNDEYVQYGTKRFDGNVHYEICRGYRNTLTVELHDERSVGDADLLRLHVRASQKHLCRDLVYDSDWSDFGIAVRCSDAITCCRDPAAIHQDLEEKMRKQYDAFEKLLCEAERVGIDNLTPLEEGCMDLPEMHELPKDVEYTHEVVDPKSDDIDKQSLFWVPTISELFGRKEIPLPDGRWMIPGQYIIPEYQRKYAWTSRQVSQLCRDLLRHAKHFAKRQTQPSYHIGTIILQSDAKSDAFYVVDGQQRLRTISRLLGQKFFQKETAQLPIDCKFSPKDELTIYGVLTEFTKEDRDCILDTLLNATVVCISVKDVTEAFQLFSTQNGRGKPLSAPNLLKAYHLHELERSKVFLDGPDFDIKKAREELSRTYDRKWEESNAAYTDHDGKLLAQVLGEHLYRIRCWCRGEFPKIPFGGRQVDEFKGITLPEDVSQDLGEHSVPLQNLSVLRKLFGKTRVADPMSKIEPRSLGDGLNAFVAIDQPIVNGEDFFDYALTYAGAYKNLFTAAGCEIKGLSEFRKFYEAHCLYDGFTRRGDGYARHVFESLCLFCYDRFGERGLIECQNELYRCAYFERATKSRCYYVTCGSAYAVDAVRCMLASATIVALKDRLHELCREMKENFRDELNCGNVPSGLKVVRKVFNTFEDENDGM